MKEQFDAFLTQISNFLPGIFGALLTLVVGWFIAMGVSNLISSLVGKTGLQERLNKKNSGLDLKKMTKKLIYYIIMAMVLLLVLEVLGVQHVLDPLEGMLEQFANALPRIVGALIIGFVGYILATIVSDLIGMASGAIEKFTDRYHLGTSGIDATKLLKHVVFLLIFVPLLITAFDYLNMTVISDPAKMMLVELMGAIPNIIAAAIILVVFYFIGRYVTNMLAQLIANMNGDKLPATLGVKNLLGGASFSKLISNLAFFFIMFFGIITAVEKLQFVQLSGLLEELLGLSGQIFFGLVIMAIGNFISNIAHKSLRESNSFLAGIARYAVLGLFLAIALRSMGIADDIINLAFGLVLGAVAVAIALSFGLGGREAAGKHMEILLKKFRKED